MPSLAIVWFRRDLRLSDNPALMAALATHQTVIPVYIHDETCGRTEGGASLWWLHHSLTALDQSLKRKKSRLILRRGPAAECLHDLIKQTGASAVYWNRLYDEPSRERDTAIKTALKKKNITAESFNGSLLKEPWEMKTKTGNEYRVFTPFWKNMAADINLDPPLPVPKTVRPAINWPTSDALDDWRLLPTKPDWAGGFREMWRVGEDAAAERFDDFLEAAVTAYPDGRDRPALAATSRLSPHLHFGEISPRQVWQRAKIYMAAHKATAGGALAYLREIGWREFSYHLLFHAPSLATKNWNTRFDSFPWAKVTQVKNKKNLEAWQKGQTGYPIVDAGMRELWTTGWMHNRVRMIAASFLIKHLMIDWRHGEQWFWDTLVDADPANNAASWQWVAGSGADASPYFRIFNPVLQGEKFDSDGQYVRRWVPELATMPNKFIHHPWDAPADVLKAAGVVLGKTYPQPLIDHSLARARALEAYGQTK